MKKPDPGALSPPPRFEPPMNCDAVLDALEPYLDAELDAAPQAAVESHLEACDACLEELRWARRVQQELRHLPQLSMPESLVHSSTAEASLAEVVELDSRRPSPAVGHTAPASPQAAQLHAVKSRDVPASTSSLQASKRSGNWRHRSLLAAVLALLALGLALSWSSSRSLMGPPSVPSSTPLSTENALPTVSEPPQTMAQLAPPSAVLPEETPERPGGVEVRAPATSTSSEAPVPVTTVPVTAVPVATVQAATAVKSASVSTGPASQLSDPELARAEEEMRLALAYINGIHRQAALTLREQMQEHVVSAPYRGLQRLSHIDFPST